MPLNDVTEGCGRGQATFGCVAASLTNGEADTCHVLLAAIRFVDCYLYFKMGTRSQENPLLFHLSVNKEGYDPLSQNTFPPGDNIQILPSASS